MSDSLKFDESVVAKIDHYVYRLVDPRNGETFYVGKGSGNRVFDHVNCELNASEEDLAPKLDRIRQIRLAGLEVGHVIHRHGMSDAVAIEVEAALIDAYPGLSNDIGGAGSSDYGPMHARQIVERYRAEEIVFQHRVLMITVNQSAESNDLYDAVRFAWRLSKEKAEQAEVVLAVVRGVVRGVFVPERWMAGTPANFPTLARNTENAHRLGFEGREAPTDIREQYLNKQVPASMRARGSANPVRYSWK